MAHVVADRVRETTTTTGTGTYTLAGAVTGFETFGSIGNSNTTYYCCTDGTNFEVGVGTYTSSGTTLARTTILQSSNSDNAVNWSSGTRQIFCTLPAEKSVVLDTDNDLTVALNTDASAEIGRSHIGYMGYSDFAGFSHIDQNGTGSYALLQYNNGATYLNAASGQLIYLRNNNSDTAVVSSTGLYLYAGKTLQFEGATADAYETTVTVADPTADRTITFPNATGTVLVQDSSNDVTITSSDSGQWKDPVLILDRASSSPADDDYMGRIEFSGRNSANETITYAGITGKTEDVTDGTEDGAILFNGMVDGTLNTFLILAPDTSTFQNSDILAKTSDGALLKLQTSDTTVADGDVIGAIEFSAPDEASGTDAITTAASIVAEADATFSSSANNTDLLFKLGTSGAATEKMRLTHEGNLTLKGAATGAYIRLNRDDTTVSDGNIIGGISFAAHNEASGTDAITTAASITAEADATFAADNNKTDMVFKLGQSGTATEVMRLEHEGNIILTADDSSSSGEPTLELYRNSSSPADDDNIGKVVFSGRNDNSQNVDYMILKGIIDDASDGTEDGSFQIRTMVNGSNTLVLNSSGTTLTASGEIAAASLDISGDVDVDGTLEADAMTLNGTAITTTATLSTGISNNNVPKFTSGVADNDFLRVDGTAIEGRSASEVLSDIGGTTASDAANEATALAIALG